MPEIRPIHAICFRLPTGRDLSAVISPPYDVLDEVSKQQLLEIDPHNITAIDLPHTPPKVVGPDHVYEKAGQTFRHWLDTGVLEYRPKPALFAYQQSFMVQKPGAIQPVQMQRRGLMANVRVEEFGPLSDDVGGICPHEETFPSGREDRLRLMRASKVQLSPIFGLYRDVDGMVGQSLAEVIELTEPVYFGTTSHGRVRHELWAIEQVDLIDRMARAASSANIYIADGHHRYNTAIEYLAELGPVPNDHPARFCTFVLTAMQDPGLVIRPTHRVLGGMPSFQFDRFIAVSKGRLHVDIFSEGDLIALEMALPKADRHAIGLYDPTGIHAIATPVDPDPLSATHPSASLAWRQLDVTIATHLVVEQLCEPNLCPPGQRITWKYPHELSELKSIAQGNDFQLGLVMQPTPLDAIMQVSEARELMPPKSTFFYPKLATGLVINPLDITMSR